MPGGPGDGGYGRARYSGYSQHASSDTGALVGVGPGRCHTPSPPLSEGPDGVPGHLKATAKQQETPMADTPPRQVQRRSDESAAGSVSEAPGRTEAVPTPRYQGLFVEPDLPPFAETE